jgi:benzoylformate decarboxylase
MTEGSTRWEQRTRDGAQAIAEQLRIAGLVGQSDSLLIGNPGSGEEWLYIALTNEVVLGLSEASVGHIADGAGRVGSKPAVIICHGFVGFSGIQGAVFNAAQRQSPMLVVVGVADSHQATAESHMFADVEGAARSSRVKYVKVASDPTTLLPDLRDAIIEASTPPYGPAVFVVGSNIASAPNDEKAINPAIPNKRLSPPNSVIEGLAKQLLGANVPTIIVGDGVARSEANQELQQLAELLGANVWASMESEVNLRRHHPCFRGNLGHMDDSRGRDLLADVDFALAVGTPVYQTVFFSRKPLLQTGARLATINYDLATSIRGHNDVNFPLLGDPKTILAALVRVIEQNQTPEQAKNAQARFQKLESAKLEAIKRSRDPTLDPPGVTVAKFGRALEKRMAELSQRPVIFNEALIGAAGLTDHIENVNLFGKYFDTSGGALGEWAGSIGATLIGHRTIAIIGDGGFHYAPQALWNAAHKNLKLGFVVTNNGGYGLLYDNMNFALKQHGIDTSTVPRKHYYEVSGIDYVSIAKGYGVPGMRVDQEKKIDEAISKMLSADGPYLLELVLPRYQ